MTWNGDHEVFYTKGTGPRGRIDPGVTSKSGYYILMSVYKYNFKTKKDKLILKSDGQEIYRVQGVLTDRALVVSNQSNARSPHYKLEVRDLDGTYRATLFTSEKEMSFIGWLQPKVEQ